MFTDKQTHRRETRPPKTPGILTGFSTNRKNREETRKPALGTEGGNWAAELMLKDFCEYGGGGASD